LISIMSGGFPGIVAYVVAVFIIPEEPVGYSNNNMFREANPEFKTNNEDEIK
jgi:hypothetical protein